MASSIRCEVFKLRYDENERFQTLVHDLLFFACEMPPSHPRQALLPIMTSHR
ncbi:hypothetical protein C1645_767576 [Glomus cerebriforme]|uniref:Uncharacterized protein n=1 Tax=Glomus cerebriforme TaxID=658196 RepID=A0A397T243_9GLOM|nr:hypothetical protein C1645_767576 [Glomus cerebriforme]